MADDLSAKLILRAQAEGAEQLREVADDVARVGDGAAQAAPELDGMGNTAQRAGGQLDVAGEAARKLGRYLATAFTARELVQAAAEMERLRSGLQAVAGDADKAAQEMAFVRDMATRAGVGVVAAGRAYLSLAAATKGTAVEGQATREVFEAVSTSMARAGKSSAETGQALTALAQMSAKGVVSMEEMRQQLGEALPGAFQAAASGMGVTVQELGRLIESGQVTAQDIFPALTRGLKQLYEDAPQAQTLAQEIQNVKNAFVEMADNLAQAGGGNALKAFAESAQAALALLDVSLVALGRQWGAFAGALATLDFSGLTQAFGEIEREAQAKLARAAQHNDVLRAGLQALGETAQQAAGDVQAAGAVAQEAGGQAQAAAPSYQALAAAYKQVGEELARQIDLAERDVKAVKARGEAAVAQARLLGDEQALRAAVGRAAADEAAALQRLAEQRQTDVDVLRAELENKRALLAAAGPVSAERKKELDDLEALIAQRQIDADAALAQAAAAQANARARGEAVQAAQAEREAVQAASVERVADARVSVELLRSQRALAQQSEQMARLMGDEVSARRERIRQMELDAQITRAQAQVQRAQAEGAVAVAQAMLAEMRARGEANQVKEAELQASIRMAQAKIQEVAVLEKSAQATEFAAAKMRELGEASAQVGGRTREAAEEAADGARSAGEAHEQMAQAIEYSWVSAQAAASRYRDEAVAHADELEGKWQSLEALGNAPLSWGMYFEAWNNHFDTLTRLADEYVATMEALDRQQQAIERSNSGAARSVEQLKMRLLELSGSEEQVAAARRARDEAEVRRQIKLAEIEVARAQARNDAGAEQRYREEIALLNEQLALLGQVFAAEEKQRKAREREGAGGKGGRAGGGQGGGAGGGVAGGGAGGGVTAGGPGPTVNITLNASGVNDPVRLARMIEPELKKLARLAR